MGNETYQDLEEQARKEKNKISDKIKDTAKELRTYLDAEPHHEDSSNTKNIKRGKHDTGIYAE